MEPRAGGWTTWSCMGTGHGIDGIAHAKGRTTRILTMYVYDDRAKAYFTMTTHSDCVEGWPFCELSGERSRCVESPREAASAPPHIIIWQNVAV